MVVNIRSSQLGQLLLSNVLLLYLSGGIITEEDLALYEANVTEALSIDLSGGLRVYSVPPPGSGAVLDLSMLVLDGYGFNSSSIADDESSALTYHRIVESFKFGYAHRTFLGDPHFVDITEVSINTVKL